MSENWKHLKSQLEFFKAPFPREAIEFANLNRDELAPHLAEVLAQVAAEPSLAEQDDYVLHQYALHLLGAWRDTRAFAPLLALAQLDSTTLDVVLNDALTESYGRILAAVCDGDTTPLKALIENAGLDVWVREAAVTALVVRVLEGDDERLPLVQYLLAVGEQETARIAVPATRSENGYLFDILMRAAGHLVALEMRGLVERWDQQGLIDWFLYSRAKFNAELSRTFEQAQAHALGSGRGYVKDVEAELGGWTGFSQALRPSPCGTAAGKVPASITTQTPFEPSWPAAATEPFVRDTPKTGRNDPCPCGSGKKYKKCCGTH